jgi:2-methylisocitrate lyase-like PEP mutase family enzyme
MAWIMHRVPASANIFVHARKSVAGSAPCRYSVHMHDQTSSAAQFRVLHTLRPLVLLNAWDAASARVFEASGALAIGTTSGGISWSYGRKDGQSLGRSEMLSALATITRAVSVPVNADLESGYGTGSPHDVIDTVRAAVAIGIAGINLEDSPGPDGAALLTPQAHAERIHAARAVSSALVINARIDIYLHKVGEPSTRFEETIARAALYRQAGADCIFVPGVVDTALIANLAGAIAGPLNIMVGQGAPTIAELGRLNVARVSVGSALAQRALSAAGQAARELLATGTCDGLSASQSFAELNALFDT